MMCRKNLEATADVHAASCTASDRRTLTRMDVNDIGKQANECGAEAYSMFSGAFSRETFNTCFTKKVSISSTCSECYAASGEYGAKNCKAACLLGWCKQGCLDCTAPATEKVAKCVGADFQPVSPCLEADLEATADVHATNVCPNGLCPDGVGRCLPCLEADIQAGHIDDHSFNDDPFGLQAGIEEVSVQADHIDDHSFNDDPFGLEASLNSTADAATPWLDHLGDDCFAACYGVTGKCPSSFCGIAGWCCRWGLEWDTPGCYHVGCHGKHCCARRGGFGLDNAANATEVMV